MSPYYLVETFQQQKFVVGVWAESEEQALTRIYDQQGGVQCILPPSLLSEKSTITRCSANNES